MAKISPKKFRVSLRTVQYERMGGVLMTITQFFDPDAQAYDLTVSSPSELDLFVADKTKAFMASGKTCSVDIGYAPRQRQRDDYNAVIDQWRKSARMAAAA